MKRKCLIILTSLIFAVLFINQADVRATITLDNIYDEECFVEPGVPGTTCGTNKEAGNYFTDSKFIGDFASNNQGNEYDFIRAHGSLSVISNVGFYTLTERRDVYSFIISDDYNVDLEFSLVTTNHDDKIDLDLHILKFNEYNLYNNFADETTIDGNSIVASSLNPHTEDSEFISTTLESGIYYIVIDGTSNYTTRDIINYTLEVTRTDKSTVAEVTIPYADWGNEDNEVIVWNSNLFASQLNPIGILGKDNLSTQDMTAFYNSQNLIGPNEGYFNRVSYIFTEEAFTETRQALNDLNSFLNGELVNGYQYNEDIDQILEVSFIITGQGASMVLKASLTAVGASNPVTLVTGIVVSKVILPLLKETLANDLKYDLTDIEEFQERVNNIASSLQTLVGYDGTLNFEVSKDSPVVLREMIYFDDDGIMKYYYQINEFTDHSGLLSTNPLLDGYIETTQVGGDWLNYKNTSQISSKLDQTDAMYQHLIDMGKTSTYANNVSQMFLTEAIFSGTLITNSTLQDNDLIENAIPADYTIDIEEHSTGNTNTFHYYTYLDWYNYMTGPSAGVGDWLTLEESQKHINISGDLTSDKFYKFSVDSINTLEFYLDRENSTIEFDLYRKTDGGAYAAMYPENPNDELYKAYMVYPGEYYVKVSGTTDELVYNNVEYRNGFLLEGTMNFIDKETEEFEYNNSLYTATNLQLQHAGYPLPNDVKYVSIDSELKELNIEQTTGNVYRFGDDSEVYNRYSDVDYYRFTVTDPSNLTLSVSNISSGEAVDITIYNSSFTPVYSANDKVNSFTHESQISAGTYYVRIDNSSTLVNGQTLNYTLYMYTCDNKAPTITLNGSSLVYVPKSASYYYWDDLDANVIDEFTDMDISATQTVNLGTPKEQTITYTYTDPFGLTASIDRTVRVYEYQNQYKLQKWSQTTSTWLQDYVDPIGYFSYSHSGREIYNSDSTNKIVYGSTSRQNSYSYKKYELYDKVCFQQYRNDTTFGSDWNYIDETIGGEFCRWFDTGYSGDIGDDNNYDHYEYKYGFSYIGDSSLYRYNYPDKYDIRNTDNAYYYKVTDYDQNDYKNPSYSTYNTGWTSLFKYDGNSGDYYYDYSYKTQTYIDAYGVSKTTSIRYLSYSMSFYLDWSYAYVDVNPLEYMYSTSTPSAATGYRWYDTGVNRLNYGQYN